MKAIEKAVHMVNGKKVVASLSGHCGTGDASSGGHGLCREWWETPSVVAKCRCECHKMMEAKVERKIVAKSMGKARTGMKAEANAKVLVKKSL